MLTRCVCVSRIQLNKQIVPGGGGQDGVGNEGKAAYRAEGVLIDCGLHTVLSID